MVAEVTDDGPGIDPEVAPRMFDRFAADPQQDETARARRYGIGLALVSEITAAHHGTVTAEPAPAGGTTLRLSLPTTNPPAGRLRRGGSKKPPRFRGQAD